MPTYNHDDFDPPAPVALVDIRDQATGKTVAHIPMLMDTGADVTLVPRPRLTERLAQGLTRPLTRPSA